MLRRSKVMLGRSFRFGGGIRLAPPYTERELGIRMRAFLLTLTFLAIGSPAFAGPACKAWFRGSSASSKVPIQAIYILSPKENGEQIYRWSDRPDTAIERAIESLNLKGIDSLNVNTVDLSDNGGVVITPKWRGGEKFDQLLGRIQNELRNSFFEVRASVVPVRIEGKIDAAKSKRILADVPRGLTAIEFQGFIEATAKKRGIKVRVTARLNGREWSYKEFETGPVNITWRGPKTSVQRFIDDLTSTGHPFRAE